MFTPDKFLAFCMEEFGPPQVRYQIRDVFNSDPGEWQLQLWYSDGKSEAGYNLEANFFPGLLADMLEVVLQIHHEPLLKIDPNVLDERVNKLNGGAGRPGRIRVNTEGPPIVLWVFTLFITDRASLPTLRAQFFSALIETMSVHNDDIDYLEGKSRAPVAEDAAQKSKERILGETVH